MLAAWAALPEARQQAPTLPAVLKAAADYVAAFRQQLSEIVAEETYTQDIVYTGRVTNLPVAPRRRLRSDLFLVKPSDADRYVELRDVFEVDGQPVRDRQSRVEALLGSHARDAGMQLESIIAASARYNIGSIQRNINTPLMPLQFLDAARQPSFSFKHVTKAQPVFTDARDQAINEAGVFRVSTEMWTVEYREQKRNTIIRSVSGGNMPARGRFWINPETGAVLISEMIVEGGGVVATVTVSYQSEPLMGFLVPVEMRETYIRSGERIGGHAEYGRFRPVKP